MEKENKMVKMSKDEAEKELKGYKIIVEDLGNGEKEEYLIDCFMAVINNKNEDRVARLMITQCNPIVMLHTMKALENLRREAMLQTLKGMGDLGDLLSEDDEDEE